MSFRFQVVSDLHLEMWSGKFLEIESLCDILFLVGDIGNYRNSNFVEFLDYVSENWKQSFYVTGNHEYYKHVKEMADIKYKSILDKYDNITLLNKDVGVVELENFNIIGCTLWSSPIDSGVEGLNDFRYIKVQRSTKAVGRMGIWDIKKWNKEDINFLKSSIEDVDNKKKTIVITHFMPILTDDLEDSKYPSSQYDYYYGNDGLKELINKCDLWLFGHTHDCCDQNIGKCRLIANACGYPNEETRFQNKEYILNP